MITIQPSRPGEIRKPRLVLTSALLLAIAAALPACGLPDEGDEADGESNQALRPVFPYQTIETSLYYGYSILPGPRFMKIACNVTCANNNWIPAMGNEPPKCVRWVHDCTDNVRSVTLHADKASLGGDPWGGYAEPNWSYQGCGPQVLANLFHYYTGGEVPVWRAKQLTRTLQLRVPVAFANDIVLDENIATRPDDLVSSLDQNLDSQTGFFVRRVSGTSLDSVKMVLLKGHPVVALINDGGHWVIITGYRAPNFYYIVDYPNRGRWARDYELGFNFTGRTARWASKIPVGTGGYESGTILTIRSEAPPGTGQGGSGIDGCDSDAPGWGQCDNGWYWESNSCSCQPPDKSAECPGYYERSTGICDPA